MKDRDPIEKIADDFMKKNEKWTKMLSSINIEGSAK